MILTPLQKLPKNVADLGKLIVAKGLKTLPNLVTLDMNYLVICYCFYFKFVTDRTQAHGRFEVKKLQIHFTASVWGTADM